MLQTAIAGSLPKPSWLAETEKLWPAWRLADDALAQAKLDATALWIAEQEAAGLSIVGDGEQSRIHFVHGFLEGVSGIDWAQKTAMGIRNNRYVAQVPTVTAAVSRPAPVHLVEVRFARARTTRKLKFTLPGPMTICDTLADAHYGRRADMAMAFADLLNAEARDLAAAGADIVQFDEPAFNAFPAEAADWGIAALERAAHGLGVTTAVHICYGYGIAANIEWKKELGAEWRHYESFFPALDRSAIDQVSLEFANSRVPGELMRLLPRKQIMVGVIDVAESRVETPEEVASRIGEASQFVDRERLIACTNCGLAPLPRDIATGKIVALGQGARLAAR